MGIINIKSLAFPIIFLLIARVYAQDPHPTLEDFWEGEAEWIVDIEDVGLPIGESDTIILPDGTYRSYLHASNQSAMVVDQCGTPVEFPGCTTIWESTDTGETFELVAPVCIMTCQSCPCTDDNDHITAQQYPRIAIADDMMYMAYEWHAQVILRTSADGIQWSDWEFLITPGGTWPTSYVACSEIEQIGEHPHIRGQADGCLVGGPPGIFVEGDTLYVFVMAGSAPSHMRCYKGDRHGDLSQLVQCDHDPLFTGAEEYGDIEVLGEDANAFFDFRYISSADVVKVGDHYYMSYEGIRGPDVLERGMDTQFGLGFARSIGSEIDGEWELFTGNPILMNLSPNWGIGHADIVIFDDITYLYTATDEQTRGRYRLIWKTNEDDGNETGSS